MRIRTPLQMLLAGLTTISLLLTQDAVASSASEKLTEHPGYFAFDELESLMSDSTSIEINLHGPLLRLVAAATRRDDPEFSEVIANLEAVRVRIAPVEDLDLPKIRAGLERASGWLEENHWQTIFRSRDTNEDISIYLREAAGEISGIAVLAIDMDGEAALINVVGRMNIDQIGRLGQALDLPQLSQPQEPEAKKDPKP